MMYVLMICFFIASTNAFIPAIRGVPRLSSRSLSLSMASPSQKLLETVCSY